MSKILTSPAGNIRLELRDDRLSAWLTIIGREEMSNERDILDLIEQAGIKTGFEEAAKYMRKHGLEKDFDTAFPIAMCNRVQGETKLSYYFDLEKARHFDGRVTINDLSQLTCIEAGTVVADFNGNIFDRQGSIYDIYGEMLEDEEFKPEAVQRLIGVNVSYDFQRRQFVASSAGYPSVGEDGRISVIAQLYIEGDVTNPVPELRCPVSLAITGTISGTRITAGGNLSIGGSVISSTLLCQGDLIVGEGIEVCQQPGLEIWGDISCAAIKSSTVLCRGKLTFTDSIRTSEIYADGGINTETGSISGGHLESGDTVEAKDLGDAQGGATELEITISPFYKAQLMQLTKDLIRLKQAESPASAALEDLNARIRSCELELDRELNTYLQQPRPEKLRLSVRGELFPPVSIRILKHEYTIKERKSHLEILEKD